MSAGFTPGPWQAWIAGTTVCVLDSKGDQHKPIVAWMGFDGCNRPLRQQDANAHLIAAAPEQNSALHTTRRELLRLKQLFSHSLATPGYGQDENSAAEAQAHIDDADAAIRKADAALRKARGESS